MVVLSTSGMRGVVGDDLDPKYILKLVEAFIELIQNRRCVVGCDSRSSSMMLLEIIVAKLLYEKCEVHNLGIITTPALSYYLRDKDLLGGVMITASHNPPNWNGVKFFLKGGRGPSGEDIRNLVVKMDHGPSENSMLKNSGYGSLFEDSSLSYSNSIVSYVGRNSCEGIHVALDLGGGSGYSLVPTIFYKIGCDVTLVNASPGEFRRGLDPTVDALSELRRVVIEKGCNVGFAYDCDGDRVVVVDNNGQKLSSDATLFMVVTYLSNFSDIREVCVSVDTTSAIENTMLASGGRVIYSRVGEANVVHELLKHRCQLGGEGSSAGVIIPEISYCRDGILTSALLSRALAEHNSLQNLIVGLSDYHRIRRKISYDMEKVPKLIDYLSKTQKNVDLLDGVKINLQNKSWILIRPSGTEQVLRISVEAPSQKEAELLMSKYLNLLRDWNLQGSLNNG